MSQCCIKIGGRGGGEVRRGRLSGHEEQDGAGVPGQDQMASSVGLMAGSSQDSIEGLK